jgi:hypothetical protein
MPNSATHPPKRTNAMPKLRVRLLLPLSAMIVALSACHESPTQPGPGLDATGQWVGTVNGVRVRLDLAEHYVSDGFLSGYVLNGTGSITIVSTGDSLPFVAGGLHTSGPTGVLVNFEVPDNQGYYGHFWGQVNSAGALAGAIDGSVPNTIGPFQGGAFADKPITLTRP